MENIEIEDKAQLNTINTSTTQLPLTKPKKFKKKSKKPKDKKDKKEKKCTGLKELLEQINQEKLEKNKIAKEKDKKEIPENIIIEESKKILSKNENEEKNIIKDYINNFNNSISGTTVATLSLDDLNDFQKNNFEKNSDINSKCEYIGLKPNYLIKNCEISEDEKIEGEQGGTNYKRKISSPMCDYFEGFDKILCETHKGSVDMTNSMNFIKKEDFISSGSFINNNYNYNYNDLNYFINPEENNHENNINNYNNNIIIENNNYINNDNNNINDIKDNINDKKDENMGNNNTNNTNNPININNINEINKNNEYDQLILDDNNLSMPIFMPSDDYSNFDMHYSQLMDYYNTVMPEISYNSKFNLLNNDFNNKYNKSKHYNKKNKNDKNKFKKYKRDKSHPVRDGDWLCQFCFNMNFSFRAFCNRCKAPKQ